jgi:hypothetical protein
VAVDEGNNSTLRRKLFACFHDDDDDDGDIDGKGDDDHDDIDIHDDARSATSEDDDDAKENDADISNIIVPGSVLMTPTAEKREKSPTHTVSIAPESRERFLSDKFENRTSETIKPFLQKKICHR